MKRALLPLLLLSACAAPVGVTGPMVVPADAGETCRAQCATIGFDLSAVAIMANNVGCVCQPKGSVGAPVTAAVEGAMTALEQRREQQAQQSSAAPPLL